jgi:cohesin loading factor subunit SCC2
MIGIRQKFLTLLEDIFEAADSLPAEPDLDSLHNNAFFDRLSTDGSTVLLKTEAIERITRYVVRLNTAKQSGAEKVAIWDEESLKRVFRLLERSMRDAEHTDPFPNDKKAVEAKVKKEKGKKGKKVKAEGSSQEVESMESANPAELGGEEVREAEARLSAAAASMRAVECCLACLDTEGLSKPVSSRPLLNVHCEGKLTFQLYSEDLISLCVGQIKQHLSSIIFPVIEGMAGDSKSSFPVTSLANNQNPTPATFLT